ncbi:hypothetical protein MMC11_007629 [Xylographa trunciseda]|nr:hypothetical protein [Xylographa trunciseda]
MWSTGSFYLSLAFLLSLPSAHGQKSTTEVCSTKYGATSVSPVPSTTFKTSTTFTLTVRSTTTPTITVTPKPTTTHSTITDVVTKTVASTTDTISETDTVYVYITSTGTTAFTVFVTSTVTSTEPTPSSTVATSSGFTYPNPPPSPTAAAKKRAASLYSPDPQRESLKVEERAAGNGVAVQQARLDVAKGTVKHSPVQYPTSVVCTETIEAFSTTTFVSTAHRTTTTAPKPTVTGAPTTITTTSTTSIYESFTVISFTTTITGTVLTNVPSTTTQITTETATLIPPTETFYAACDAQNIISPPSGYYFAGQAFNPPSYQVGVQLPQNSSYDCCVACITSPYCKVAEFFSDPTYNDVTCTLDYGDSTTSCDAETVDVTIGDGGEEFVQTFSGGNCDGGFVFSYQGY